MSAPLWFESALDESLRAEVCANRLDALRAEYMPKRDAFDRYLKGNGPRVDLPEFYRDDFTILNCAKREFERSADLTWELYRTDDEVVS